jgi:hypothetical protein
MSSTEKDGLVAGGATVDDLVQRAAGLRERAGVLGDYL